MSIPIIDLSTREGRDMLRELNKHPIERFMEEERLRIRDPIAFALSQPLPKCTLPEFYQFKDDSTVC